MQGQAQGAAGEWPGAVEAQGLQHPAGQRPAGRPAGGLLAEVQKAWAASLAGGTAPEAAALVRAIEGADTIPARYAPSAAAFGPDGRITFLWGVGRWDGRGASAEDRGDHWRWTAAGGPRTGTAGRSEAAWCEELERELAAG